MSSRVSVSPLIPFHLSLSPLLHGTSDDLSSTLAAQGISIPLPTLSFASTINRKSPRITFHPSSWSLGARKAVAAPAIPPKAIIDLISTLERMDNDVNDEVVRVRSVIKDAHALVSEHREDQKMQAEQVKARRKKERRETKEIDDDFWLNV